MNHTLVKEIIELGGDPSDEIWVWLVTRGPHGASFSWGQTRDNPPGYVGVVHLQRIVGELATTIPHFQERALRIVNAAMSAQSPNLVQRAIQVAAVIGGEAELQRVKLLASNPESSVASDARACVFYLKHRK